MANNPYNLNQRPYVPGMPRIISINTPVPQARPKRDVVGKLSFVMSVVSVFLGIVSFSGFISRDFVPLLCLDSVFSIITGGVSLVASLIAFLKRRRGKILLSVILAVIGICLGILAICLANVYDLL